MNHIIETVFNLNMAAPDDSTFISELEQLIKNEGHEGYQAIINALTNLEITAEEAKTHWDNILIHRETMTQNMAREVALITALCDYFSSQTQLLSNPKLLEISSFKKVVTESTNDNLTGLFNKSFFLSTLEQQISIANRHSSELSVLFIDVDDFKEVNDIYGHQAGDLVLKNVANILLEETRSSDVVARYGGEEFVILMPHTDHLNAFVLAERIRKRVADNKQNLHGKKCHVTISGGLASFPFHSKTSHEIIKMSDSAMYRAKGAGKNNIALFRYDKRRFLRIALKTPVKIKSLGFNTSQIFSATSKDIGIGGILFEYDKPLTIGVKLQLSIELNQGEPLLLIGTVVRVEIIGQDLYDIGITISFKEIEKTAKDGISKLLTKHPK